MPMVSKCFQWQSNSSTKNMVVGWFSGSCLKKYVQSSNCIISTNSGDTRSFFCKNPALFLALLFFLPKKKIVYSEVTLSKGSCDLQLRGSSYVQKTPSEGNDGERVANLPDGWRPVWRVPALFFFEKVFPPYSIPEMTLPQT